MRLVRVARSPAPGKKLRATFVRDGRTLTRDFGASGHGDFTRYWARSPALARRKRLQYLARHGASGTERWQDPTTPGSLARYILWEKPTVAQGVAAFRRRFRV